MLFTLKPTAQETQSIRNFAVFRLPKKRNLYVTLQFFDCKVTK